MRAPLERRLARAIQRFDTAQGHFAERIFDLQFESLDGGESQPIVQPFTSLGGRFVRLVAIRGTAQTRRGIAISDLDLAHLKLRLQLNAQSDFIGGNNTNRISFAMLFSDDPAPWYWLYSPPRIRTGDLLTATVDNSYPFDSENPRSMIPELGLRLIDDDLWTALYARDQVEAEAG